jgi:hypothetical protein
MPKSIDVQRAVGNDHRRDEAPDRGDIENGARYRRDEQATDLNDVAFVQADRMHDEPVPREPTGGRSADRVYLGRQIPHEWQAVNRDCGPVREYWRDPSGFDDGLHPE